MDFVHHQHPQQSTQRIVHIVVAIFIVIALVSVPVQVIVGLTLPNAPLFVLTGLATLLLIPPLVMLTAATPPVTVTESGLRLQPLIWRERLVRWDEIAAVKPYPLLPPTDTETLRRGMVGRKNYRAAAGIMLIVPSLPIQYRATGFFAGEGLKPVIAFTNRTHTRYNDLVKSIAKAT